MEKSASAKQKVIRKQFDLFIEGINEPIRVNERIKTELKANKNCNDFLKIETINDDEKVTIKKSYFDKDRHVKIVYRYSIKKEGSRFEQYYFIEKGKEFLSSNYNDYNFDFENNLPIIVLILESPHKNEYEYLKKTFNPIAPAQGTTGKEIHEKLCEIINNEKISNELTQSEYKIVIMNPIPAQTSLYFLHKKSLSSVYKTLRDKVWSILWENEDYKKKFIRFIKNKDIALVLNCCTANLSDVISETLKEEGKEYIVLNHPSSWWTGKLFK